MPRTLHHCDQVHQSIEREASLSIVQSLATMDGVIKIRDRIILLRSLFHHSLPANGCASSGACNSIHTPRDGHRVLHSIAGESNPYPAAMPSPLPLPSYRRLPLPQGKEGVPISTQDITTLP